MPVPPSSPAVGTRYPSYTSYSYRSPSSSSYLGRTTSLDRSYATSYGSSYSSAFSNKYSLPPRPAYSSVSESYRSSRSLRQSPVRPSYSRLSSDSHLESLPTSRYSSRYGRGEATNRETSSSRDSGYGSRLSSRDRSVDVVNGNGVESSHYTSSSSSSSSSSYGSYHRREKEKEDAPNAEAEKVRITDRIRAFESRNASREAGGGGLLAGREGSGSRDAGLSTLRDVGVRERSYLSGRDSSSSRRRAAAAAGSYADVPSSRSSSVRKASSPETPRDDAAAAAAAEDNANSVERRPSVTELCRKYDANHNVTTNGVKRQDEEEDGSEGSAAPPVHSSPALKVRSRNSSCSRNERAESPIRADSPVRNHVDSSSSSSHLDHKESRNHVDSPSRGYRESPNKTRVESPADRDDRSSPLTNGAVDKPKIRVELESGYDSTRSRYRRDRVRERIAARLARETEDEDSVPRRHQSTISNSSSSGGVLSENNGLVGLRNIGNTCFMNSVTQCLSNTRCLLEYLVRDGYSSDVNSTISTMKGDLVCAFANLLSDMWNDSGDNSRALNTGPFKSQIQRFAPVFSGYQQHDAQEFLRKLLEGLHEDVNRVAAKPKPITDDIDDNLDDNQKAMESWKRYLRYDDSKIVDMFVGQLKSSLQCSVCGHCSVTFDPFWDLSLPIPNKAGQVRLSQCLDLFTKEEVLDGDERPTCSKCKERRRMTKSFSIQKFPKVFVLHLKRFSPLERWRGKLSCTVEFPLEGLNFARYASNSSTSPLYNLIGVANHSGTTYSGHYTAYCKHPYSGNWHEYNDSRVTHMSTSRICSPEAYVLFYELSSASSKL